MAHQQFRTTEPLPYIVTGDYNSWEVDHDEATRIVTNPAVYSPRFKVTPNPEYKGVPSLTTTEVK